MKTPLTIFILVSFIVTGTIGPIPVSAEVGAYSNTPLHLPKPGVMVHLSPPANPAMLKGIKVHPDNPFRFEFIMDAGDPVGARHAVPLRDDASRLIKYFLASLTIPEHDLWVNLSPYEKNRIVPESFGQTEMGRDLLAQDYMLKQITASLIYPEDEIGKRFWKRIYEEAAKKYGTTNIPVSTFNKVWIVPDKAGIYKTNDTAFVVQSHLKVMVEEDYVSANKDNAAGVKADGSPKTNAIGSQIIREIIIPELTKEVNENQNFANLRQIYNSLILATWFKKHLKNSVLNKIYVNKNKVFGVNVENRNAKEEIFAQYLTAFKKGVYNYIKEEPDVITQQKVPRKYFSGGAQFGQVPNILTQDHLISEVRCSQAMLVSVNLQARNDPAMPTSKESSKMGKPLESIEIPHIFLKPNSRIPLQIANIRQGVFLDDVAKEELTLQDVSLLQRKIVRLNNAQDGQVIRDFLRAEENRDYASGKEPRMIIKRIKDQTYILPYSSYHKGASPVLLKVLSQMNIPSNAQGPVFFTDVSYIINQNDHQKIDSLTGHFAGTQIYLLKADFLSLIDSMSPESKLREIILQLVLEELFGQTSQRSKTVNLEDQWGRFKNLLDENKLDPINSICFLTERHFIAPEFFLHELEQWNIQTVTLDQRDAINTILRFIINNDPNVENLTRATKFLYKMDSQAVISLANLETTSLALEQDSLNQMSADEKIKFILVLTQLTQGEHRLHLLMKAYKIFKEARNLEQWSRKQRLKDISLGFAQIGAYQQAIEVTLNEKDQDFEVLFNIAEIQWKAGDWEGANRTFEKALTIVQASDRMQDRYINLILRMTKIQGVSHPQEAKRTLQQLTNTPFNTLMQVAVVFARLGFEYDAKNMFLKLRRNALSSKEGLTRQADALKKIAKQQMEIGYSPQATLEELRRIIRQKEIGSGLNWRVFTLIEIVKTEIKEGFDYEQDLKLAQHLAGFIDKVDSFEIMKSFAQIEIMIGKDARSYLQKAQESFRDVEDYQKRKPLNEIIKIQLDGGYLTEAIETMGLIRGGVEGDLYSRLIILLAESGQYEEALQRTGGETFEKIISIYKNKPGNRAEKARIKRLLNNLKELREEKETKEKIRYWSKIAMCQIDLGFKKDAQETISQVKVLIGKLETHDNIDRPGYWLWMAELEMKAGIKVDLKILTKEVLSLTNKKYYENFSSKTDALLSLARILQKNKMDSTEILREFINICEEERSDSENEGYYEVIDALIELGQFQREFDYDASKTYRTAYGLIDGSYYEDTSNESNYSEDKNTDFNNVMKAQIKAGYFKDALTTIESLEYNDKIAGYLNMYNTAKKSNKLDIQNHAFNQLSIQGQNFSFGDITDASTAIFSLPRIRFLVKAYLDGQIKLDLKSVLNLMRILESDLFSFEDGIMERRATLLQLTERALKERYGNIPEIENILRRFFSKIERDQERFSKSANDPKALEELGRELRNRNLSLINTVNLIELYHMYYPKMSYFLIWLLTQDVHVRPVANLRYVIMQASSQKVSYKPLLLYLLQAPYISQREEREKDYTKRWQLLKKYKTLMSLISRLEIEQSVVSDIMKDFSSDFDFTRTEEFFKIGIKKVLEQYLEKPLDDLQEIKNVDELVNILIYMKNMSGEDDDGEDEEGNQGVLKEIIHKYLTSGSKAAWDYIKTLGGNEDYKDEKNFLEGPGAMKFVVKEVEDVEQFIRSRKQMLYEDIKRHMEWLKNDYSKDKKVVDAIEKLSIQFGENVDEDILKIKTILAELKAKELGKGGIQKSNSHAKDMEERIFNIQNLKAQTLRNVTDEITIDISQDPIETLHLGVGFPSCLDCIDGEYKVHAFENLVDLNKRVIYVKDSQGRRIGRVVLALAKEGEKKIILPISIFYTNTTFDLNGHMLSFLKAYSRHTGYNLLITNNIISGLQGPKQEANIKLEEAVARTIYSDFGFEVGEGRINESVWRYTPDGAMSVAQKQEVGGIDLNPTAITMLESGQDIQMKIPADLKNLETLQFDGFIPVIINITPIVNLPLFLGSNQAQEVVTH